MIEYRYLSRKSDFESTELEALKEWRDRYQRLCSLLGEVGTPISWRIHTHNNPRLDGLSFITDAEHEYIFPSQNVSLIRQSKRDIVGLPGYEEQVEEALYNHNPTHVRRRVGVNYSDERFSIHLRVQALQGRFHQILGLESFVLNELPIYK